MGSFNSIGERVFVPLNTICSVKCAAPERPADSFEEPALTAMDKLTDLTPFILCENISIPLLSLAVVATAESTQSLPVVSSLRFSSPSIVITGAFLFASGFSQIDLSTLLNLAANYLYFVTHVKFGCRVFYITFHVGNVKKACFTRCQFNKYPILFNTGNLSGVFLVRYKRFQHSVYVFCRCVTLFGIITVNINLPFFIVNLYLHIKFRSDELDRLSSRSDDFSNGFLGNIKRYGYRCIF